MGFFGNRRNADSERRQYDNTVANVTNAIRVITSMQPGSNVDVTDVMNAIDVIKKHGSASEQAYVRSAERMLGGIKDIRNRG